MKVLVGLAVLSLIATCDSENAVNFKPALGDSSVVTAMQLINLHLNTLDHQKVLDVISATKKADTGYIYTFDIDTGGASSRYLCHIEYYQPPSPRPPQLRKGPQCQKTSK